MGLPGKAYVCTCQKGICYLLNEWEYEVADRKCYLASSFIFPAKNESPKVCWRAVPILISYCYISWQCRGTFQRVQARSMIYHSSKQQIQWGLPASCSRPLERRIISSDNRLVLGQQWHPLHLVPACTREMEWYWTMCSCCTNLYCFL